MHGELVALSCLLLAAVFVDATANNQETVHNKRFDYNFNKRDGKAAEVTAADVIGEVQRELATAMMYLDGLQNGVKFNEKRRNKFEFIRFGRK